MAHTGSRVVAHMKDGTLIRGRTGDFRPGRDVFTVSTWADHVRVKVPVSELKALFFVKSIGGNPKHVHSNTFEDGTKVGRRVWVVFADGEELAGRVLSAKPELDGFFLFPVDPRSNLERAWVVASNTRDVFFDEEATEASTRYESSHREAPVGALASTPDRWDDTLRLRNLATPEPWSKSRPVRSTRDDSDIFLGDW